MSIEKALRFTSSADWRGGELTTTTAAGRPMLKVAPPSELGGTVAGVWSPEELLVAATASCLTVTIAEVARAQGVELARVDVDGVGHLAQSAEGPYRFVNIELTVEVEADGEHPHVLQGLVEVAERRCLVTAALSVPVSVRLVLATAVGVALSG
jgi:organic hydroperoxide reductase OsmC/OhrA